MSATTTTVSTTPAPLRGPAFGSYEPDEVAWLLCDLSHLALEAPTGERESSRQRGVGHYAQSLPVEYEPGPAYLQAFHAALAAGARASAHALGTMISTVRAARGDDLVLVSLARAGTPVGVLARRWLAREGIEAEHYSVSIVRGRGIDEVALCHLAQRHDSARVVFVDGWTGKGAIATELAAAVTAFNEREATAFDPTLAVLADPGGCTPLHGTREDLLIASACLNSTVSGLVSRTVMGPGLLAPGAYHGAKHYSHLRDQDLSARFVDTISAHFPEVAGQVAAQAGAHLAADRSPTWAGAACVADLARRWSTSVNMVKPGVGETTRVLLRRVPEVVLVRSLGDRGLAHVLALAAERGVAVLERGDLAYRCVGIVADVGGDLS